MADSFAHFVFVFVFLGIREGMCVSRLERYHLTGIYSAAPFPVVSNVTLTTDLNRIPAHSPPPSFPPNSQIVGGGGVLRQPLFNEGGAQE